MLTNFELSLHSLLVPLAVLLLNRLIVLNCLDELGLDEVRLFNLSKRWSIRGRPTAYLLLANLPISSGTSLPLKRLNSALEGRTQCAGVFHKLVKLCRIFVGGGIIHIVERARMEVANAGNIVVEIP